MNAIAKMQMKAGIASRMLSHSILLTCCIMRKPTITSAGAVAKEGIVRNRGEKNRASRKSAPDAIAVRPVRPPSAIPDADSTKVVMVEVPRKLALFVEKVSLSCAADQGSKCIEHVDEQEREHNYDEVHAQDAGEVQFEECGSNGSGHGDDSGRNNAVEACFGIRNIEADELADDAEYPCRDDAEKDRALDIAKHKDRSDQDAEDSQKNGDAFGIESAVRDR